MTCLTRRASGLVRFEPVQAFGTGVASGEDACGGTVRQERVAGSAEGHEAAGAVSVMQGSR